MGDREVGKWRSGGGAGGQNLKKGGKAIYVVFIK